MWVKDDGSPTDMYQGEWKELEYFWVEDEVTPTPSTLNHKP